MREYCNVPSNEQNILPTGNSFMAKPAHYQNQIKGGLNVISVFKEEFPVKIFCMQCQLRISIEN